MERDAMLRNVDQRFFATSTTARPRAGQPWRTDEVRLLREHYPKGGSAAALAVLPERERKAISLKAASLGLRAPGNPRTPTPTPTKYPVSEAIDAEIRRAYLEPPESGEVNDLSRRLMRPRAWIARRAEKLGLIVPRYKPQDWSKAELEIIETHAHQTYDWIRQRLARRGYKRTTSAVASKVKRLDLDRNPDDPDNWSTSQLASLFGVSSVTVFRWITQEGLPATRRGTGYFINRADLRRWIGSHAQLVDLRKVERYWFIDLMAGGIAKRRSGKDAE